MNNGFNYQFVFRMLMLLINWLPCLDMASSTDYKLMTSRPLTEAFGLTGILSAL